MSEFVRVVSCLFALSRRDGTTTTPSDGGPPTQTLAHANITRAKSSIKMERDRGRKHKRRALKECGKRKSEIISIQGSLFYITASSMVFEKSLFHRYYQVLLQDPKLIKSLKLYMPCNIVNRWFASHVSLIGARFFFVSSFRFFAKEQ